MEGSSEYEKVLFNINKESYELSYFQVITITFSKISRTFPYTQNCEAEVELWRELADIYAGSGDLCLEQCI